jgi:radical SAM protein with 4Fe4S-binding SPASM domain
MSYRDFRRIICKLDAINTLIVEILGGEPFLLPWIADALAYIADHQITPEVSTNGSVLNQRTISRLARIDPLIINISIHGFGQVHDKAVGASHFQKVKKALLLLNDFGINHCISCVVFRNNLNKITQLCDFLGTLEKSSRLNLLFCQSLGMAVKNNVCISLLEFWKEYSLIKNYIKSKGYKIYVTTDAPFNFYIENSPKPKNELERQLVGCEALKVRIEILPNGDIYPCCQFFDIPRFKLGNALKDDIGEIWEKFSPDFLKSKISEPKCKENCKYYIECTGCYGYAIRSGIKYDNRCPGYKDA